MNANVGDAADLFNKIDQLLAGEIIFESLRHSTDDIAQDTFVERANRVAHRAGGVFDMSLDGFVDVEQADLMGLFFERESAVGAAVRNQEIVFYQALKYFSHVVFGRTGTLGNLYHIELYISLCDEYHAVDSDRPGFGESEYFRHEMLLTV